jgi:hypothetical protein
MTSSLKKIHYERRRGVARENCVKTKYYVVLSLQYNKPISCFLIFYLTSVVSLLNFMSASVAPFRLLTFPMS